MSKKTVLNQIVAVVTGRKSDYQKRITKLHHSTKQDMVDGLIRRYQPYDDADKTIPNNDSKAIQVDLRQTVREFGNLFEETVNLIATQDVANCKAKADVEVDGKTILKDVPITHLLYLEKALDDMRTFVESLPELRKDFKWKWDKERDCYATEPVESTRTGKRKVRFVKAEATDKHPAQVDVFDEDIGIGTWSTTYISQALDVPTKKQFLANINALRDAVKKAREVANSIEVEPQGYGGAVVRFCFENGFVHGGEQGQMGGIISATK